MPRLLLDEGISPAISPRLWAEHIDNYALRDRGLLGLADHEIWALAKKEDRTVATINGADFRRLARRDKVHAGLIVIPSGGSRDDHFRFILRGVVQASFTDTALRSSITEVLSDGGVRIETTLSPMIDP